MVVADKSYMKAKKRLNSSINLLFSYPDIPKYVSLQCVWFESGSDVTYTECFIKSSCKPNLEKVHAHAHKRELVASTYNDYKIASMSLAI